MFGSKQRQNSTFGERWHFEANASGNNEQQRPKPFLWGQPPNFTLTDKAPTNSLELSSSSCVNALDEDSLNTNICGKSPPHSTRPPWEYSSEEEKEGTGGRSPRAKDWNVESAWDGEQASASALSAVCSPNLETVVAGTSIECDRSKDIVDKTQLRQPIFNRRQRAAITYEKITFRSANSGLTILLPKGHPDLSAAYRIASDTYSHGYSVENASKALVRFLRRKILSLERSQYLVVEDRAAWNSMVHICRKFITVHSIGIKNAKFEGHGATVKEAVDNCDLAILYELFDFDVIKEANVEINNPQRKNFLDTARKLDLKTQAWLDCSTENFAKKIKEISDRSDIFY